jgi:hypothetical protein
MIKGVRERMEAAHRRFQVRVEAMTLEQLQKAGDKMPIWIDENLTSDSPNGILQSSADLLGNFVRACEWEIKLRREHEDAAKREKFIAELTAKKHKPQSYLPVHWDKFYE